LHQALLSPWIDRDMYSSALGGSLGDLTTVACYLEKSATQRPDISLFFDRTWYRGRYPDVAASELDALYHFLTDGILEMRSPHPLIDVEFINLQDPSYFCGKPSIAALLELIELGLSDPSPYFSVLHYETLVGSERADVGPLRHFLSHGLFQGYRPHPLLDVFWYAGHYPDVPREPYAALRHFVMVGDLQGRRSCTLFDGEQYRNRYPDVAAARQPALKHYLVDGKLESRQALCEQRLPLSAAEAASSQFTLAAEAPLPSPTSLRQHYETFVNETCRMRQMLVDGFLPTQQAAFAIAECEPDSATTFLRTLNLRSSLKPKVTIIIPVYDELAYTIECLRSLQFHEPLAEYEVIIADDASSKPDMRHLADIPGVTVIRQNHNIGFLRNCNAAFSAAHGEYIFLLNNDTQLLGPVIDILLKSLESDPSIAAAGPKIVYPNGRLQEAGCSLDSHGVTQMIGLLRNPSELCWNFGRDVHYVSGAALMVRRSQIGKNLFDEQFSPAYCEDADLCLALQSRGGRIRYCPEAVVSHHLSVSTAKSSTNRRLQLVTRNQAKLSEKWKERLITMNKVRAVAFYLPQFHPTLENDRWWGRGFTEWTNVTRARPSYQGHYQPHLPADLGFYDLRVTEVFAEQARLAKRYGVSGFCVYYYNFDGRRVLHAAFEKMLEDSTIAFPFCICWANENWTRHWDGGSQAILLEQNYSEASLGLVVDDALRYARDARYLTVDGKPLLVIYRPLLLPDPAGFSALCRARFKDAGFRDVHLVYVESMEAIKANITPADIGFDACIEFPPQGLAVPAKTDAKLLKPDWSGYRYDYQSTAQAFIHRPWPSYARYPGVFPSWDNTPRQSRKGTSFNNISPGFFQAYIEAKLDEIQALLVGSQRILFINAWNEWAEGAHLEPDQKHGHQWLEALRSALGNKGCLG
jgi:GT2 family glycosyltransferase